MIDRFLRAFGKGLALLALVALGSASARADDQERMQGTWKATHAQIGSNHATPAAKQVATRNCCRPLRS